MLGASLTFLPIAHAEIKTYDGIGEYIMSDFETPDIAKQRAKVRAEQNAVEQAGVYVKSYTKIVNHVVTTDEVMAIANNIIKIVDERYTITPNNDTGGSFRVNVAIKVVIDSDKIDNWLNRERQYNYELIEQNIKLQKDRDALDKEVTLLRKQLSKGNNEDKNILKKSLEISDRNFLSLQKLEEGNRLFEEKKYIESIDLCSQAIGLNEQNADAYASRGRAYGMQYNYKQAMSDFSKAIDIDSNAAIAYNGRGLIYVELGNYNQGVADLYKAISINPQYAMPHNNLAIAFGKQGDYKKAMEELNKAIEIDPRLSIAYSNRGNVYNDLGDYEKAIVELNKAISIDAYNYKAYTIRGIVYGKIGQYQKAIDNFDKAISINNRFAAAYHFRGYVNEILGNKIQANKDYLMADSLENNG